MVQDTFNRATLAGVVVSALLLGGLLLPDSAWASNENCPEYICGALDAEDDQFNVEGAIPPAQEDNGTEPAGDTEVAGAEQETGVQSEGDIDPERLISITRGYCMDIQGVAMQDCLQAEQAACTEPGSQWLIRLQYPANDPEALEEVGRQFCSTSDVEVVDDPASEAPPMPVVTLADFRALDIAPSQIESDSGGFGLIRANTNFYATEGPQTLETTMLGQAVAIQAVPVQWTWDYGDGSESRSNPFPGGPQREFNQETTTSHVYEDTGEFPVSLTTAYRGQFQVNGGPWIAIPGTAEVPSDPTTADIWRSKSKNVAENCVENPEGWACGNPFIED